MITEVTKKRLRFSSYVFVALFAMYSLFMHETFGFLMISRGIEVS